ncbi:MULTISPECIES: tetratricopeptide repeat protein [Vagococcus]|uniref:TPR-repeat-containing protein n=1 Tax=Vagococcus fluvialis bH819 TaxID=1255619 RepID=A0A1X6WMX5_9ENTE|nr:MULTISPECIES: tetratricopeptide repeat protein [Vagococcus]SLM85691.1 TPR-repeat-containing protein [Vagococcus fluvialis bH819]HCM90113.1 tetratricopeptide repeat protein [Vagococcus sp.]
MSNSKEMLQALSNGDLVAAKLAFEKAQIEDLAEERLQLADNLFQLGFVEESEALYLKLFEEFPEEETFKISLAEIAIENDDLDKAFTYLESIEETSDLYAQSLITQADIYQMLNIPEVSESKLNQAKKLLPNEPLLDLSLAELYFSNEDYIKAIKVYEELKEILSVEESPINISERIGVSLSRIGDFEQAVTYLEEAIEVEETVERLFQLALTYYQLEENERAIDLLTQVRLMDEAFSQVYYPLAQILFDEGRHEETIETIELGISQNPYETALYHLASETSYHLGDKEQAKQYLEEVISLEIEADISKMKLAELLLKENNFDEVIELINTLEVKEQSFAEWILAQAYNGLEDFSKASEHYEAAKGTLLDDPEFVKDYALFLREEGNTEESGRLLKAYISMEPGDLEVASLIENEGW